MLLKSKQIAYLGMLLAINQIILLSSIIFTTNTLVIYALAALTVGIVIIEFKLNLGVTFYIASSLLAWILVPDKIQIITYIGFFGLYSIVKYLIESFINRKNLSVIIEFILKIVFFNLELTIYYFIMKEFIVMPISVTWYIIVLAEAFFVAYDYFLGYFLHVYVNKVKPKLKIKR
jgi:hypothetical protein